MTSILHDQFLHFTEFSILVLLEQGASEIELASLRNLLSSTSDHLFSDIYAVQTNAFDRETIARLRVYLSSISQIASLLHNFFLLCDNRILAKVYLETQKDAFLQLVDTPALDLILSDMLRTMTDIENLILECLCVSQY